MSFSGQFTITKQDNIQYNYFRMKRKLIGVTIMTFLLMGILVMLIRYGQGIPVENAISVGIVAAVAGAALMIAASLIAVILRVNKLYKSGRMSDFTVHYIIDKTGIHAKSERGDTDFVWKQILLARETSHAIYLIAGENRAAVIPKGQIANDGELNAIRALLKKYVAAGRVIVAG